MNLPLILQDRVCLVTGGTRGIGLATARQLATLGAQTVITWSQDELDARDAEQQIAKAGKPPLVIRAAVEDKQQVDQCVKEIIKHFGKIDVLVNNAAINQVYPIPLLEQEDWQHLMRINLEGVYLVTRAVIRHMIKAQYGRIINLGSFASERLVESPLHYASSKSGLRGFTEALAIEVGKHSILVNLVAPGLIDEGMSTMVPQHHIDLYLEHCALHRLGKAEEIAELICFLASDNNTALTGGKLAVDGGL